MSALFEKVENGEVLSQSNRQGHHVGYQNDQQDFVQANILPNMVIKTIHSVKLIYKLTKKYQLISFIGSIFWSFSPPIVPPYNLLMQENDEIEAANEAN